MNNRKLVKKSRQQAIVVRDGAARKVWNTYTGSFCCFDSFTENFVYYLVIFFYWVTIIIVIVDIRRADNRGIKGGITILVCLPSSIFVGFSPNKFRYIKGEITSIFDLWTIGKLWYNSYRQDRQLDQLDQMYQNWISSMWVLSANEKKKSQYISRPPY